MKQLALHMLKNEKKHKSKPKQKANSIHSWECRRGDRQWKAELKQEHRIKGRENIYSPCLDSQCSRN